jgi:hypothetical protein
MRPKGKLLTLILLFAAVGLIIATGAFSTVEAERTATVDVAGDANALLQLQSENDDYVSTTGGVIQIDLEGNNDATGLNPDARTVLTPLVNITNQGGHEVIVNITASNDGSQIDGQDFDDVVTIVDGDGNEYADETVPSGQSASAFGLEIDLTDVTEGADFSFDITIKANETE